jgi:hypothetical protein
MKNFNYTRISTASLAHRKVRKVLQQEYLRPLCSLWLNFFLDIRSRYLFSWNDILGIDCDRFIEVLKNHYNIYNMNRYNIKKVDDSTAQS